MHMHDVRSEYRNLAQQATRSTDDRYTPEKPHRHSASIIDEVERNAFAIQLLMVVRRLHHLDIDSSASYSGRD
jgi:hypothetical protein